MKVKLLLIIFSLCLISCDESTQDDSVLKESEDKKTPVRIWRTIDSGYEFKEYEKNI